MFMANAGNVQNRMASNMEIANFFIIPS
jgi:hypothetical protein